MNYILYSSWIRIFSVFSHYKSDSILHIFIVDGTSTLVIDSISRPCRFFVPRKFKHVIRRVFTMNKILCCCTFLDVPEFAYLRVNFHLCIIPSFAIIPFRTFIASSTLLLLTITVRDIHLVWLLIYFKQIV